MKIVEASAELIPQLHGLEGVYKQIEMAGRTAYKSEDKITDTSAEKFVKMLMTRKHNAALEHGTVYLKYRCKWEGDTLTDFYERNPYSDVIVKFNEDDYENDWAMSTFYITTNYRVIVENNRSRDLKYMSLPYNKHVKRYTLKFTLSRGIANEFVRHRVFSFLQESTRYCNYSKDKFGNELTFIIPEKLNMLIEGRCYFDNGVTWSINPFNGSVWDTQFINSDFVNQKEIEEWLNSLRVSSDTYFRLLNLYKWKPEEARDVLPLDLKTELIMTGTTEQWREFLNLRCASDAHPDARYLANKVKEILNL